ncbi:MAG: LysR family transcriptional regulator [Archangium sp.]|nr:LysR family transcriptional regulator [Archangium sp.]
MSEKLDLNLLIAFEALWLERSVTGAGKRLGLSQPATSGALARLREMLGDRLFVRAKNSLEPTDRCVELAMPLRKSLVELRTVLAGSTFDPKTTTRVLRVGAVDAAIAVLMPAVLARTMTEAPHAQVHVSAIDPTRATQLLEEGQLDLAFSPVPSSSATVRARVLYPVDFVVALRVKHPALKKPASLAEYPRVHVRFQGQPHVNAAATMSSFLAVPPVLRKTDAWALLPAPYAEPLARDGVLATMKRPAHLTVPPLKMQMLWPDAQHDAPASTWLRELVLATASSLAAT